MSEENTPEVTFGEALLLRLLQDQMKTLNKSTTFPLPSIPEVQPLTNEQDQKLLDQLALTLKMIGDRLNQDKNYTHMLDRLAQLGDRMIFSKLVESVLHDEQLNWGRIIVLLYTVTKLAVKMLMLHLPRVFSAILDSCLDFFRTTVSVWIDNHGGWICSISALTLFSITLYTSTSSHCTIPRPVSLTVSFFCGVLLGGTIVWKLSRST